MRPLVKRTPDGRPYSVPSAPPSPVPPVAAHSLDDADGGPEPTPRPQEGHGMGRAKLTDDEVRAIRSEYAAGKWTRKDLAYIYDISVAAINSVLGGRSYTHVGAGPTEPTPAEQDS